MKLAKVDLYISSESKGKILNDLNGDEVSRSVRKNRAMKNNNLQIICSTKLKSK